MERLTPEEIKATYNPKAGIELIAVQLKQDLEHTISDMDILIQGVIQRSDSKTSALLQAQTREFRQSLGDRLEKLNKPERT